MRANMKNQNAVNVTPDAKIVEPVYNGSGGTVCGNLGITR